LREWKGILSLISDGCSQAKFEKKRGGKILWQKRLQRPGENPELTFMDDIEDFMRKFFRARILHEQEYQKWRSGFRNSFFAPDCRYDSHAGIIERFQSEIIKSIESQNGQYKVITEQTFGRPQNDTATLLFEAGRGRLEDTTSRN
jgi:hypothetical protein